MGIEGFFLVLAGILTAGFLTSLALLLRRRRRAAVLMAVVTLLAAGGWYPLPAFDKIASLIFFPHDTVYAPRYSEHAFRKVRAGMRGPEVSALLGEPLERSRYAEENSIYWYYSRPGPHFDSYWNKIVILDASAGQVVRKIDEFYSD